MRRISASRPRAVATKTTRRNCAARSCAQRLFPLRAPPSTRVTVLSRFFIQAKRTTHSTGEAILVKDRYGLRCRAEEESSSTLPSEVDSNRQELGRSPDLRFIESGLPSQGIAASVAYLLRFSALTVAGAVLDFHQLPKKHQARTIDAGHRQKFFGFEKNLSSDPFERRYASTDIPPVHVQRHSYGNLAHTATFLLIRCMRPTALTRSRIEVLVIDLSR